MNADQIKSIINALSHRDYYEKGAVTTIELFDDRVEISNPGELLAAVGKDFGHKSISRNPLIFGLFQRIHLVEKVGSGILRMEELMLGNNLPAPIYQKEGMFTVIFKRPVADIVEETMEETVEESMEKSMEKNMEKSMEKSMEKTSDKIIELITNNSEITIFEMVEFIGVSQRSIERNLKQLQSDNRIERIGADKGGHWQIISDILKEETVEETSEKTSEKILGLIKENNSITISELAKMIGLTTRAIEKQIDKLQKENKIERIGSDKSGHWRTLPKTI